MIMMTLVYTTAIIHAISMEYEIYKYCTGMGTLVLMLIILYHCIGENKHGDRHQRAANAATN